MLLKISVEHNVFITYLDHNVDAIQFIFYYVRTKNGELVFTQIKCENFTLNYDSSDSLLIV